jgi:hypothetical protein
MALKPQIPCYGRYWSVNIGPLLLKAINDQHKSKCAAFTGQWRLNEMTKITNSYQSHKSYRKYKSENGRTRTSEYIRGGIRFHGGVSIPCWPVIWMFVWFVCLFIAARAIFQLSGGCHHYRWQGCKFWPMLGAQGLRAGRDLYRATPTATRDLGLYGLIRKTGTYVPQWDSNPRRKDHQIIAPDALTTVIWMKDSQQYENQSNNQSNSCCMPICYQGQTLKRTTMYSIRTVNEL